MARKPAASPRPRALGFAPAAVVSHQDAWTRSWHAPGVPPESPVEGTLLDVVRELHRRNFDLWHEEDKARAPRAPDAEIAQVKRRIDRLNQQRTELIERLDLGLLDSIRRLGARPGPGAPWNSETPAAAVDRLSILSLRIYHMREEEERRDASASHRATCRGRRRILERQRKDLLAALEWLVQDLVRGRKVLKSYRHFKMYNDPELNPVLYRAK